MDDTAKAKDWCDSAGLPHEYAKSLEDLMTEARVDQKKKDHARILATAQELWQETYSSQSAEGMAFLFVVGQIAADILK